MQVTITPLIGLTMFLAAFFAFFAGWLAGVLDGEQRVRTQFNDAHDRDNAEREVARQAAMDQWAALREARIKK